MESRGHVTSSRSSRAAQLPSQSRCLVPYIISSLTNLRDRVQPVIAITAMRARYYMRAVGTSCLLVNKALPWLDVTWP